MNKAVTEASPVTTERMNISDAQSAIESLIPDDGEIEAQEQAPRKGKSEDIDSEMDLDELVDESFDEDDEASEDDEITDELDEDEAEEDEDSDENPTGKLFKVKVDGEEVEVDEDELKAGYSRTKVFTKRMQEVAELRKTAEAELQATRVERDRYAQVLNQLAQEYAQEEQVDWDRLRQEDPFEYAVKVADFQRKQAERQVIESERQRLAQLQQAETIQQVQYVLATEKQKLTEALPSWKNPEKAAVEKKLIMEQGKKLGFTEAELKQVFDHRAVVALRKAALYDQLVAKKQTIKPMAEKTLKAGSSNKKSMSQAQKAQMVAAKTGKVKDAAGAIFSLLD